MAGAKENQDLESFLVTKHSWKGKYKRILSIGNQGLSTYNPDKYDLTNRWPYADVISAAPIKAGNGHEFQIVVRRSDRKIDTIKLSSEHRTDILTAILRFHKEFPEKAKPVQKYQAYKHHWSGTLLPTMLEVTPCSLDQLDPATEAVLASYQFKEIAGLIGFQDYTGGIVLACGGFSRLHLFKALNHHEIVQNIVQCAQHFLCLDIKVLKHQITLDQFEKERFGEYRSDRCQTSLSEFIVQKITPRHSEQMKRILCLTETTILERDPQTYTVCTLRPLADIFALIRDQENIQLFAVEYKNGLTRTYITNDRDSLLATLLDAVRTGGNQNVHVRLSKTPRGKRAGLLSVPVDEETEGHALKYLINNFQYQTKRMEVLERFNANIPYTGLNYSVTHDSLFAENKERLILGALQALCQKENDPTYQLNNVELEATFHALRRLLASKVGFAAFTNLSGFRQSIGEKVVASLRRNDLAVTYAAVDMINSLMHSMNADFDLKQEQLNKGSLLSTKTFLESLLEMWTTHVAHGSGALVLSAMLDFMTFALCIPYSETTDGKQFDMLLEMVAARGRSLFKLFQHPSLAIVKGAGLVLRALIEEGSSSVATQMQLLALDEAALCRHLLVALFTPSNDPTMLLHKQLSRHLIGLWITDSEDAMNLLKRIFPAGLLMFMDSEDEVPKEGSEEDKLNFRDNLKLAIQHSDRTTKKNILEKHLEGVKHWGLNLMDRQEKVNQAMKSRPIVLRNRRQRKKATESVMNLPLFFYQFQTNHELPNLIWNHKTREELRAALENELRLFTQDKELAGSLVVAWNYEEFEVQYQCLANEIKIGDYYIRLILERDDWPQNLVTDPVELFNALYRRVLCRNRLNDDQLTITSLQALAKVYKRYHEEIGYFSDMAYILQMLDRCLSPALRDALMNLIKNLALNKANCRPLTDHISCLVDLITLAHLHKGRAMPTTKTNTIEAGSVQFFEEKDWYYNVERENEKPERMGPITFSELKELWAKGVITPRTRCWAMGMDGWRSLQQIPQLKWYLMAKGQPLYNETELSQLVLDILIKCTGFFPSRARNSEAVLIPGPKLSRKLSEFVCLPHIVQVCLTHDPGLLERVATLLCQIMEDNPEMPKVYLTGVFYFMLMYTGSNILPIAKFLKMTHMKQAFRSDDTQSQSGIMHRSILGQLLPEAMVCFLENHSAEKFAEIFLGEFDTPEAIWNTEMRRLLVEKISGHIADFTPRLKGHTMARYPYIAIPVISYPQLENELFCHIFYLRHLCDTDKFPDWPIPDPVSLLKHTLNAWRTEVEKKPAQMSVQQAYESLGIDLTKHPQPDESLVRKTYYKLAQQYHPDKNPQGREMFVAVNQAYEFLCSRALSSDGPSPNNIVLILRTQSILFARYPETLKPYKYAGYPQLIKTIRLETEDEQLFAKAVPLLSAASELCYHTVHCSALNAEELRREGGIETLLEAYSRCVSILSVDSKPADLHYQVISNITKCFEVACNFENCKRKIIELPQLVMDVCRVVYFKHYLSVSLVTSLAANNYDLQCQLVCNGVLWSLLLFMFDYDYTLDESGVKTDERTNTQMLANNLAKLSVIGCCALAGFEMETLIKLSELKDIPKPAPTTTGVHQSSSSALPSSYQGGTNLILRNTYVNQANNPIRRNSGEKVCVSSSEEAIEQDDGEDTERAQQLEQEKREAFRKYAAKGEAKNIVIKQMLDKLVTPYLANKFASGKEHEVLKCLTSNTRNPYLIWDNASRTQLIDFLEEQRLNSAKNRFRDIGEVVELVSRFTLDAHRDELQIGGVFIKIYIESPTFVIQNPKQFVMDLLEYLEQAYKYLVAKKGGTTVAPLPKPPSGPMKLTIPPKPGLLEPLRPTKVGAAVVPGESIDRNSKNINSVLSEYARAKNKTKSEESATATYDFESNPNAVQHIVMVLRSLIAVITANPNVEIQCIGHFEMLFGFLAANLATDEFNQVLKRHALQIVSLVSRNKECVSEIGACEILGQFLVAIKDPDLLDEQQAVLDTLSGLLNVQRLIKEGQAKGAVMYLLDLFCNGRYAQIREAAAECLGKLTADKLSGPKIRISVCKFLPLVFLDAMIDNPSISVQMFETVHENPELIWNDKVRERVCEAVTKTVDSFSRQQRTNVKLLWKDPDTLQDILTSELVVSGVYLRLFVQNPGWTLRKPKQFLSDLLDFVVDAINRNKDEKDALDLSTKALVSLLHSQPNLADQVPVLGHIPKFFRQLSVQATAALSVLHQLAHSEICVAAIAQTECIEALKRCMEQNPTLTAQTCETLSYMCKCQHDSLIRQSLDCGLIPFLLKLLDSRLELGSNPAMVKAQIVAALKAMTNNLNYGQRVIEILNASPIWAEFRDQKHDLFIADSNIRGYLTAGTTQTAGYLTQAAHNKVEVLTSPPPMDRDDPLARNTMNDNN